jgi:hypothetical protein
MRRREYADASKLGDSGPTNGIAFQKRPDQYAGHSELRSYTMLRRGGASGKLPESGAVACDAPLGAAIRDYQSRFPWKDGSGKCA